MRKSLRLSRIFISQRLKRMMEYKIDFLTGALAFLLSQGSSILFLGVIFSNIPDLKGWKFEEIIFIYGFSLIPKGLDHLFADNLWKIGYFIVRKGDFDKYLTRPINTLYHVIIEGFEVDAFGEFFLGIFLTVYAGIKLSIVFDPLKIILLIIVVPFATMIYTSIKAATAAIAFWTRRSGHITHMFYMTNDFSKYPTSIYNGFIKTVITYIIPFALTAYYPALYLLKGVDPLFNIGMTIFISCIFALFAYYIWHRGLRAYESAGS